MFIIFRCPLAEQHQQSAHAELHGHRRPHAPQPKARRQHERQPQPDTPDARQIHQTWHQRIARAAQSARRHNRHAVERFRKQSDAQHLRRQRPHLRVRCQHPEHQRTDQHHHSARHAHEHAAHRRADIAAAFRLCVLSCADVSAHERRRRRADAVARHIAEALRRDRKRMGRNRDRAERRDDRRRGDLCAAHRRLLHRHREADLQRLP